MKQLMLAVMTFVLSGCATIDTRWDTCEKPGATFVQVADCTVQAVQADASRWSQPTMRLRSEARAKRYGAMADDLMERVASGRIFDTDARIALRRSFDELQDEERDDRLSPIRPPQKTGMTCSPTGTSVSCTPN